MKTAARKTLNLPAAVTCLAALFATASIASAAQRQLLAQGDEQHLWVARVYEVHDGKEISWKTVLQAREFGQNDYSRLRAQADRAVCLAVSKGGELVVVTDEGRWYLVDEQGSRLGPALPGNARMLAAAADQDILWALGLAEAPLPATVPAAVQPSATPLKVAASQPSITALPPPRLMVYRQTESGLWADALALPQRVSSNADELSLVIVNRQPVVAWLDPDGSIQVITLKPDRIWSPPIKVPPPLGLEDFKLIDLAGRPALWLLCNPKNAQEKPPAPFNGGILCTGNGFDSRVPLQISGMPADAGVPETFTTAFSRLLLIAQDRDGKWYDQINRPDGTTEHPAVGMAPSPPAPIPLAPWIAGGIAVVLLAAVAAIVRRRNEAIDPMPPDAKFELAPLGLRLAAGTIDFSPVVAVSYALRQLAAKDPSIWYHPATFWLLGLAAATYILHVLIAEILCSQSLGKMMFNLRVASFDGKPPDPFAIILRNALRVLDLGLLMLPLLTILFSPLRQRIGDLAGGTVVLFRQAPEEEQTTTED